MGNPRDAWKVRCPRHRMCPSCEAKRAAKRAYELRQRLRTAHYYHEEDLVVGVLTTTLPGQDHPIRHGSLRDQYDYVTDRIYISGLSGVHSMRGLNKVLAELGAEGGTHYMEFTYNNSKGWWNVHMHSVFYGCGELDHLQATSSHYEENGELLLKKRNKGKVSNLFSNLGFGPRYTLDYAEEHEIENILKYSSKVAYATKPFKAPISKSGEIDDFMTKSIRLARPFGRNAKGLDTLPPDYGI